MPFGRFPQPYRGQPRPKYPKPKKQIRNLKLENRLINLVIGIGVSITLLILGMLLWIYRDNLNGSAFAAMGFIILFSIFFISAIVNGLMSINKFRKSYDVDTSDEKEKEDKSTEPKSFTDS